MADDPWAKYSVGPSVAPAGTAPAPPAPAADDPYAQFSVAPPLSAPPVNPKSGAAAADPWLKYSPQHQTHQTQTLPTDLGAALEHQGFLESAWQSLKGIFTAPFQVGAFNAETERQRQQALQLEKNGTPEQKRAFAKNVLLTNIPLASTLYKVNRGNYAGAAGDVAGMVALPLISKTAAAIPEARAVRVGQGVGGMAGGALGHKLGLPGLGGELSAAGAGAVIGGEVAPMVRNTLVGLSDLPFGRNAGTGQMPIFSKPPAAPSIPLQLTAGPRITPAPPDTSFVRSAPGQYATREPLPVSRQLPAGPKITPMPKATDPSFVRAVPGQYAETEPGFQAPATTAPEAAVTKTPGQTYAESEGYDWGKTSAKDRQLFEDIARAQENVAQQESAPPAKTAPPETKPPETPPPETPPPETPPPETPPPETPPPETKPPETETPPPKKETAPQGGRLYSKSKSPHMEATSQFHALGTDMELPGSPAGRGLPKGTGTALARDLYNKNWSELTPGEIGTFIEFMNTNGRLPTTQDLNGGLFPVPGMARGGMLRFPNRQETLSSLGYNPTHFANGGGVDEGAPPASAYGQELQRVEPILDTKIKNFVQAIAGKPPSEDAAWQAQTNLENLLGLNFPQAAREYVKYKQSNPVRRKLTDLMVQHVVSSKGDSYINDVLNNKLPRYEQMYASPYADEGMAYQQAVFSGLRNLLQDKSISGTVMKHLTDFRQLEQPVPFVQSQVSYPSSDDGDQYADGGEVEDDGLTPDVSSSINYNFPQDGLGAIQLGAHPGQFYQQPITINPERSKQRMFGDYRDPSGPPGPARPPRPALPLEMQLQQPQADDNDLLGKYILDLMAGGVGSLMRASEKFSEPTPGTTAEGVGALHDVASGGLGLATPFMLGPATATPTAFLKTAGTLLGAGGAQWATEKEMQQRGFAPEYTQAAGDVAGLLGGAAVHGALHGTPEPYGVGWGDVKGVLEGLPSKEALEAIETATRARMRASGAFEPGMTSGSGAGGLGQNIKDIATLTGAQLGSGMYTVGEAAAARARQIRAHMQQWREQELTPETQEAFQNVRKANPEIDAVGDFMAPLEVQKVISSPKQVEAMSRLLRVLPTSEKMAAMATAGIPKLGWYRGSAQALMDVFGADAPRFAQALAATSPQTSVESNLINTLNIWKNWVAEGRPTDRDSILRIMGKSVQGGGTEDSALDAWKNNTVAALSAKDPMSLTLSGPKVDSFQHNLRDHVLQVTNDAWMANAFGVAQKLFQGSGANTAAGNPGMTTGYAATSARVRQGAAEAGMLPSQGQETIWSVAMQLYELARENNMDPRDVLQQGMLTPKALTSTPDFSTLLRKPQYAQILIDAGYGKELEGMKAFMAQQQQHPGLTLPQQNLLMESAGTLNDLMQMRGRESRSQQFAMPQGWTGKIPKATSKSETSLAKRQQMFDELYPQTATGVSNIETIPGSTTEHLPEIADLPMSGREHYTSTIYGAHMDPQGKDIIQTASGLGTMPSRNVQGAYYNAKGKLEKQPGRALPYEVNLGWRIPGETPEQPIPYAARREPYIDPQTQANLEGGLAAHLLVNAQEAAGSNVLTPVPLEGQLRPEGQPWVEPQPPAQGEIKPWVEPEPTMRNIVVPLDKETSEETIGKVARRYPQYGFASAGSDMHVLGLDNVIPYTDALKIQKMLKGKSFIPAENAGTYLSMADKWDRLWGSREVTGEVLNRVNQMSPDAYAALDQRIRQTAGDTWDNYDRYERTKNMTLRPDLMNALKIVSKYGLQGLQAAYNNKAFLPGVAAAILLPPLLQPTNEQQ